MSSDVVARADTPRAADSGGLSSLGQRCSNALSTPDTCSDGKSVCTTSWTLGTNEGFCSYPCETLMAECGGANGVEFGARKMVCALKVVTNEVTQHYCVFACTWQGTTYPCPQGFRCYPYFAGALGLCWPDY